MGSMSGMFGIGSMSGMGEYMQVMSSMRSMVNMSRYGRCTRQVFVRRSRHEASHALLLQYDQWRRHEANAGQAIRVVGVWSGVAVYVCHAVGVWEGSMLSSRALGLGSRCMGMLMACCVGGRSAS